MGDMRRFRIGRSAEPFQRRADAGVAQLVERLTVDQKVSGSSPGAGNQVLTSRCVAGRLL